MKKAALILWLVAVVMVVAYLFLFDWVGVEIGNNLYMGGLEAYLSNSVVFPAVTLQWYYIALLFCLVGFAFYLAFKRWWKA